MDLWTLIIPSLAFVLGMYTLGAGISDGLEKLGQQLALRDLLDDTLSEEAPEDGADIRSEIKPTGISPTRTY